MFRFSDCEEIMTLAFFVLIQYQSVSDGQTDRRTDRQTDSPPLAIPAVCIARYANALVKMTIGPTGPEFCWKFSFVSRRPKVLLAAQYLSECQM